MGYKHSLNYKNHFMRPKLPEIWFNKIGRTTEKSDIRPSAINEKSVNLPLAKYLLAHIRPKIVQRLQPPKIVNGDENQPKNVYNATKRHFWGGENELAGKRRDGQRHFLDDQHPTVPSCPSWGMVGWGPGSNLLYMESVKGLTIR